MKKFLLIAGGAVIMSAASVWGYSYYQEQTMDPWLKANIAALTDAESPAQGEEGTPVSVCYMSGGDAPYDRIKVCNSSTSSNMIYPCAEEYYTGRGVASLCTVKK